MGEQRQAPTGHLLFGSVAEKRDRGPGVHRNLCAEQRVRHLDDDAGDCAACEEVDVVVECLGFVGAGNECVLEHVDGGGVAGERVVDDPGEGT